MLSKNLSIFSAICALFLIATTIGIFHNHPTTPHRRTSQTKPSKSLPGGSPIADTNKYTDFPQRPPDDIPYIGRLQVLNGFGADGAAEKVADFLRTNKYDVKHIGNAASWNYPFTLVVSRVRDMTIARQVAKTLNTGHLVMIRTEDRTYDVTVIIGPDYRKRLR